jgi:hypothetical protein
MTTGKVARNAEKHDNDENTAAHGVTKPSVPASADGNVPTISPQSSMPGVKDQVHVRMYRQGLGDCFLITLPSSGKHPFHIVIDCGVVLGTPADGISKLAGAVQDIATVTGGQIDLLVITHEHWDHVSGFTQARKLIQQSWKVSQIWVAWTEDPHDALANKLRAERAQAESALRMAVDSLHAYAQFDQAMRVSSVLDFLGAASGSTAEALSFAKTLAGSNLRFCQPGEPPITLPEVPGFRIYVMGPPKDEKLLRKSLPSAGDAYGVDDNSLAANAMFLSALSRAAGVANDDGGASDTALADPFEVRFQTSLANAQSDDFFEQRYFGPLRDDSLTERKSHERLQDQSWRRIDSDWLGTSEELALALDSATNNTSLVLAFERIATGEVFLFPGDAQAGNWLSWQSLVWTDGQGKPVITGPDLLARTVFYKVGHHGSHNATLSKQGLELMTRDGIIAVIPVDHAMALKKRWGKMPLPELVERLKQKTSGRVLRVDDAIQSIEDLEAAKPDSVSAADWSAFGKSVQVTALYFDLAL